MSKPAHSVQSPAIRTEGGNAADASPEAVASSRKTLLQAVLVAAMTVPAPLLVAYLLTQGHVHVWVGGATVLFAAGCLLVLRLTNRVVPVAAVFLCGTVGVLLCMLSRDPLDTSFLFWSLAFPLASTVLLGAWGGAALGGVFLVLVLGVVSRVAAERPGAGTLHFLYCFSLAYVAVGTIVFFYERSRRNAQQRLQENARSLAESGERYRRLFELSRHGVLVVNSKGLVQDANKAAVALAGCRREQLLGTPVESLLQDKHGQLRELAGRLQVEAELRRMDGGTVPVEVSCGGVDSREGITQCVIRDITARREAEARQREQTAALSMLSESAAEFLALPAGGDEIDRFIGGGLEALVPGACIALSEVQANETAIVLKGVWGIPSSLFARCKELIGFDPVGKVYPFVDRLRSHYEQGRLVELHDGLAWFIDESMPDGTLERLNRMLNIGKVYTRGLMRGGRLVGSVHILLRPGAEIPNPGTVEAFIRQASIALHRRTVARELLAAREKAERANEAKSQFLANTSHEIRTPMNAIVGMAELALARSRDDEQRQYLESIRNAAFSLLDIIDSILDLSKIEAGRLYLENTEFDIRAVVETAYQSLALRARQKGLSFVRNVSPAVPRCLVGDPTRVRQVLVNLLSNAVKFTEKGDVVLDVDAHGSEQDRVTVRFAVRDTGIGITADKLEEVFGSFVQADGSTTRLYGGSGLGLTISRQLARMMKGDIRVESVPDEGSTFVFEAPFVRPHDNAEERTTACAGPRLEERPVERERPPTVLIAEDNDLNRRILAKMLSNWDAVVLEAGNGRDAVALAVEHTPDLVLMDVQMPVMDGLEATRRIRALESAHMPIVALTAHAMQQDRQRCLEAGMDDYLSKPYRPAQVLSLMQRHYGVVVAPSTGGRPEHHFDENELRERLGDDPEILAEALRLFVETADGKMRDIRHALSAADHDALGKAAHAVRGVALTISAPRLAELAEKLERACRRADHAEGDTLVQQISVELAAVVDRVRERLPQLR